MAFIVLPKLNYDAMKELRREMKSQKQKDENPNAADIEIDPI
jgi:hypothetical protein